MAKAGVSAAIDGGNARQEDAEPERVLLVVGKHINISFLSPHSNVIIVGDGKSEPTLEDLMLSVSDNPSFGTLIIYGHGDVINRKKNDGKPVGSRESHLISLLKERWDTIDNIKTIMSVAQNIKNIVVAACHSGAVTSEFHADPTQFKPNTSFLVSASSKHSVLGTDTNSLITRCINEAKKGPVNLAAICAKHSASNPETLQFSQVVIGKDKLPHFFTIKALAPKDIESIKDLYDKEKFKVFLSHQHQSFEYYNIGRELKAHRNIHFVVMGDEVTIRKCLVNIVNVCDEMEAATHRAMSDQGLESLHSQYLAAMPLLLAHRNKNKELEILMNEGFIASESLKLGILHQAMHDGDKALPVIRVASKQYKDATEKIDQLVRIYIAKSSVKAEGDINPRAEIRKFISEELRANIEQIPPTALISLLDHVLDTVDYIRKDDQGILQALIQAGQMPGNTNTLTSLNDKRWGGYAVLHKAVLKDRSGFATNALLQSGADVNAVSDSGETALDMALRLNKSTVLREMLLHGIKENDLETTKKILAANKFDLNQRTTSTQETAIDVAVKAQNKAAVALLLQRGVKVLKDYSSPDPHISAMLGDDPQITLAMVAKILKELVSSAPTIPETAAAAAEEVKIPNSSRRAAVDTSESAAQVQERHPDHLEAIAAQLDVKLGGMVVLSGEATSSNVAASSTPNAQSLVEKSPVTRQ